ncbi:MAG TPA: Crp/Fnr family transcriptional regulator [Pyrinomonadaceae bacterium]|jgi:CRP-like cAMP-binding protein|nr:Crp/Fnr family transcriptional regulator [Pyrinomonadaceae bacterium]
MSVTERQPSKNRILSSLPAEDLQRLSPHLEPVKLRIGQILYEAGGKIDYVYFPLNSMASLISQLSDGSSIEIGVVGYEGMVGIYAVLGVDKTPHEGMVQIPGDALRVKTSVVVDEFKRGGALHDLLLRYLQMLLLQTGQIAACNRLHTIGERLARWLLMSHDRCVCDDLPFTHDFLAIMLGIRRAGVTEAAIILQTEEFIRYRRGHITILDRAGLEDFSCECYRIVKDEFDRLIG